MTRRLFPYGVPPSDRRCTVVDLDHKGGPLRCIQTNRHGWHCIFSERGDQALCNATSYVYGQAVERVCLRPYDHLDHCMFLAASERPVNRRERMRLPERSGTVYILVREGE